jgi:hypothetical protein
MLDTHVDEIYKLPGIADLMDSLYVSVYIEADPSYEYLERNKRLSALYIYLFAHYAEPYPGSQTFTIILDPKNPEGIYGYTSGNYVDERTTTNIMSFKDNHTHIKSSLIEELTLIINRLGHSMTTVIFELFLNPQTSNHKNIQLKMSYEKVNTILSQ